MKQRKWSTTRKPGVIATFKEQGTIRTLARFFVRLVLAPITSYLLLVWGASALDYKINHSLAALSIAMVVAWYYFLYHVIRLHCMIYRPSFTHYFGYFFTATWRKSKLMVVYAVLSLAVVVAVLVYAWRGVEPHEFVSANASKSGEVRFEQINPILRVVILPLMAVGTDFEITYAKVRTKQFYEAQGLTGREPSRHYARNGYTDAVDISIRNMTKAEQRMYVYYFRALSCTAAIHGNPLHLHVSANSLTGDEALRFALAREGRRYDQF